MAENTKTGRPQIVLPPDNTRIDQFCESLASDVKICEVGGGSSSHGNPQYVIDLLPFPTGKLPSTSRVKPENWLVHDICKLPWPIEKDAYDFIICSHTLEDIRDPFGVINELMRVAPAGYIETPGRAYESSRCPFGRFPGSTHHRWLVEKEADNSLTFTFKNGRLTEFSSLQIRPYVPILKDFIGLYWSRDSKPIVARERILVEPGSDINDFVRFRAQWEKIPEEKVRRQLSREQGVRRVVYKILRTIGMR